MDNILLLSPSRWKLRRTVKVVNQVLASLGLAKHPDKTFIGRIERDLDFLGYHFLLGSIAVAGKTVENFVSRVILLYEQEPGEAFSHTGS
jgi:RNA-directed DNA polymerase